jgi:hypothetical protein
LKGVYLSSVTHITLQAQRKYLTSHHSKERNETDVFLTQPVVLLCYKEFIGMDEHYYVQLDDMVYDG